MLKTNTIVWLLSLPAVVCVLVQIGLGASLTVLFLAAFSIFVGLYGFWLFGAGNLAGWFCLFYMAGNVLFAFYAKTILGQTVESYLYAPTVSYLVQAICGAALLAALIASQWISVGRTFPPITDLPTLRFLAWASFTIGLSIEVYHTYGDRGLAGPEYGGLAMFGSLMYLGIVCRTAYVILQSRGRKHIDSVVLLMLLVSTAFGIFMNGRGNTAMPCLYFFATLLFFKGKLPLRYVVALCCGAFLFTLVAPAILVFRYMGLRDLPLGEEVKAFEYALPMMLNPEEYAFKTGQLGREVGYYSYFGGTKGQVVLGRFASIQQIDPAISKTDDGQPLGSELFFDAFRELLPTFIDPDKPTVNNSFLILTRQGLTSAAQGLYPTLPLAGEIYSLFGMWGVLSIPFGIFLAYALVLKKIGWGLYGNAYSIYILCSTVSHVHDGALEAYLGGIFRGLPLLTLLVWLLMKSYQFVAQKRVVIHRTPPKFIYNCLKIINLCENNRSLPPRAMNNPDLLFA